MESGPVTERMKTLRAWGARRERKMHRQPKCLMDQMVSGSGLFPPRLLDDHWFTIDEHRMISELTQVLSATGNASVLAKDMLTPLLYDVDVRIILDNSGSTRLDMLGSDPHIQMFNIEAKSRE